MEIEHMHLIEKDMSDSEWKGNVYNSYAAA